MFNPLVMSLFQDQWIKTWSVMLMPPVIVMLPADIEIFVCGILVAEFLHIHRRKIEMISISLHIRIRIESARIVDAMCAIGPRRKLIIGVLMFMSP